MINKEDVSCVLKILELRTKVFALNLILPNLIASTYEDYSKYEHTMTHQDESGIDDYSKFATYEFRL